MFIFGSIVFFYINIFTTDVRISGIFVFRGVIKVNYEIVQIDVKEYSKCNSIWDMKKCPFTDKFIKQIIAGDRFVYIYKIDDEFIGEGDLVINVDDSDYFIENQRIYVSRMLIKREYRNQG